VLDPIEIVAGSGQQVDVTGRPQDRRAPCHEHQRPFEDEKILVPGL